MWERSLVLILSVFRIRRIYRGLIFFSLVLILCIHVYLGIKGDRFFSDLKKFSALILCTNWCTTICITCPILRKIECIKFVCNVFLLVLVQIDLIQFEFLKKIDPFLSPGTSEYVESVLKQKKMIPYKPYVCKKHVESILGTFLTHENKNIQFEYYDMWQCTISQPLLILFVDILSYVLFSSHSLTCVICSL